MAARNVMLKRLAPPILPQRRVVVTGLGLVTPLGVGVERSWSRLIKGDCGVEVSDFLLAKILKTNTHRRQSIHSILVALV